MYELHKVYGNHWSKISKFLPGRSDNCVKNFYYSNLRKHQRQEAKNFEGLIPKRKKSKMKKRSFNPKNKSKKKNSNPNPKPKAEPSPNPIPESSSVTPENMELHDMETLYTNFLSSLSQENMASIYILSSIHLNYMSNSFNFGLG